ncbi:MAG: porphobilinogen synthase, partial [Actinomycetota bacterium]|nr:porphobilinogen synthase [Actinomycetota bacterium]
MAFDSAPFSAHRPRRLRSTPAMRDLVAETRIDVQDLVAPLFVQEYAANPVPISSLPGVVQHTIDSLRREVNELAELGVRSVMLFGIPEHKDATGSSSCATNGIAQVALGKLRADVGDDVVLIADTCVCEYTDHGHCGIVDEQGVVNNDATLGLYAATAVAQADAGAHMV